MKKKIGGITIGSILTVIFGVLAAVIWWGVVNYPSALADQAALASIIRSITL